MRKGLLKNKTFMISIILILNYQKYNPSNSIYFHLNEPQYTFNRGHLWIRSRIHALRRIYTLLHEFRFLWVSIILDRKITLWTNRFPRASKSYWNPKTIICQSSYQQWLTKWWLSKPIRLEATFLHICHDRRKRRRTFW